jgi:hypothetical protein
MFRKIEKWLYPENRFLDDIIICERSLNYSEISGIPVVSIYLDIKNKTPYSSIEMLPLGINISEFIRCYSNSQIISKEGKIEFKSILNQYQKDVLVNIKKQQDNNKNKGMLTINDFIIFYCNGRRIQIPIVKKEVKIEGL